MNSLKISILFFFNFFFLLFPGSVTCRTTCHTPLSCGNGEPGVLFPFRLEGRHREVCGIPGFSLSCSSSNKTVLELPLPGKFFVQNIYYNLRVIEIYDSDNCLPRSLLNLSLLGSPYQSDGRNENYTFLNCSSASVDLSNISSLYVHIHCLSSSAHTILATNVTTHRIQPLNSSCEVIDTVSVPVMSTLDGFSNQISDVLRLTWSRTPADDTSQGIIRKTMILVFGICIGFPILIFFICYYCPWVIRSYCYGDRRLFVAVPPQSNDRSIFSSFGYQPSFIAARGYQRSFIAAREQPVKAGLDSSIIESFPRILLDEKLRLPNPNDTTCSICISEYLPTETLKIIPSCNHYFHAKCIDQWLSMSSTCPVCRESQSLQSLFPSAVAP
ncbi:putative RING-H2 finger protein ATL21A [Papaver somniferum]|uniref:putative RING-H2 finger protein ATL21A n=1 Tax=Papaver somniferum TaxID=3469 RepID=UPI000E6FB368|nr:putative RING-H2 finger protein ATL21A [Papaver somniferum]